MLYEEKTTEIDAKKAEKSSLFFKGGHSVYQVRSNLEKSLRKKLNKLKLLRERIDIVVRTLSHDDHDDEEGSKNASILYDYVQILTPHLFCCMNIYRRRKIIEKITQIIATNFFYAY